MRRWLWCYTLTHKRTISKLASVYFKSKGLRILTCLTGIKTGKRQNDKYWSTLENELNEHDEFMLRCILHLAYMGCGNFIQLELRITLIKYEIFGVPESVNVEQVETKSVVLGTFTAEEDETLSQLFETGPSVHVSEPRMD